MGSSQHSMNIAENEHGNASELVNISVLQQLVKNLVKSELTESLDALVKNALRATCSANGIDMSSILETKPSETMAPESSKTLPIVEIKTNSDIGSTSNGVMPGDAAKNYCAPSGPETKLMAPEPSKALPRLEIKAKSDIGSTGDGVMTGDVAKKYCSPSSPDNKSYGESRIPRRRVPIVRKYPPFCGRNAPCPTKEERLKIISGNKGRDREINKVADQDGFLKKRTFEDFADFRNNPMRKRESVMVSARENFKGAAVGDKFFKGNNSGDSGRAFKETARTDLINNPERQRASNATENNSVSHRNPSGLNKRTQKANMFNKVPNKLREKIKEAARTDFINNPERQRASNAIENNSVSHRNHSGSNKGAQRTNMFNEVPNQTRDKVKETVRTYFINNPEKQRASNATENNLVSHGNPSGSNKGMQNANMGNEVPNKMRDKVKETLALFRAICEELIQKEGSKVGTQEKALRRIDLKAARMIKERGKEVNTGTQIIGSVPGVEVGDEFLYRVELVIVGVHRLHQAGIDYVKHGSIIIATSVIASEGYSDDLGNADVLIYSGHGGNHDGRKNNKGPEDQKLEKGNLALKNCIFTRNPVRVTRGFLKDTCSMNNRARVVAYTYDGLYTVEKYWTEVGPHGKIEYKFELKRNPGQPRVAWKRNVVKIQKW